MPSTAMHNDRYGLPVTTGSARAVERYVEAVDRQLAGHAGTEECLNEALVADDGLALARIALAREHQFQGRVAEARQEMARARALTEGATRRERQHVEAIARSIEGDGPGSLALIREHLAEFPRDAYVLQQANGPFGLIGFGGAQDRHEQMFALLDGVAGAYGDDWWFLSAYSFAHHELRRFEEARRLADRAYELYPRSGQTTHSLAHIYFELNEHAAGSDFLGAWLEGYERRAIMHQHLSWHHALLAMSAGRYGRVMEIYHDSIRPAASQARAIIQITDTAALLWRCDLIRHPPGEELWQEVRDLAQHAFPRAGITFADLHCVLAYAATGDEDSLTRLIGQLREREAQGKQPAGPVVLQLAEGLAAFARGEYAETVRRIEPVRDQIVRVGGSNAQREVFEDTLLEAYLRADQFERAGALLEERLDRRMTARDLMRMGRVHAGLGEPDEARVRYQAAYAAWAGGDRDAQELTDLRRMLSLA